MANKESKTTFKADIAQLNKAFKEAAQQIRIANSEFKAATAGMEDWSNSADGVYAKLKQLNSNLDNEKKKLESLEGQLKKNVEMYGENSEQVQQLTVRINNQKAKVAETEKSIAKYGDNLEALADKTKRADISDLNDEFEKASQKIKITNSEFKAATAGMDDWAKNADGVNAKLKQLNSNLDIEKEKLDILQKQLKRTAEEYGENSDEAIKLTERINNQKSRIGETEKEIRKYEDGLRELTNKSKTAETSADNLSEKIEDVGEEAVDTTSKLDKFKDGLKTDVVGAAKIAGETILAVSVAMTAVGGASVKAGMAFDAQMSTVKSIAGATEEEFELLKAKAKEMGATTSFSATESAQALEYMAMAGWNAEQMSSGLAGIMNLAAASGEELGATSDIVTDALTAFGMKAEESEYFADVLAKTASSANTNVAMMGETFQYVAPLAGAMGYSIEDMSVAIGLMANSGIKASQAGTSLRGIITNLASPTDTVSAAMTQLGITLQHEDGTVKTFKEVLGNLRDSFAELDEVQKTEYASMIAGKNAMSGLLALINSSDADFDKLTESIKNSEGAAKDMANVRLDNLQGDITLFKSALEGAGIAISDELSPMLRTFVQEATAEIPKMQEGIAEFGGEIADIVKGALPIAKDLITGLAPVLRDVGEAIKDILPMAGDMVRNLLPPAQQIIGVIMSTIKTLNRTVLPSLTKLVGALATALSQVLEFLVPVLEGLIEVAGVITGSLIDAVAEIVDAITGRGGYTEALQETYEKARTLSDEEKALKDRTKELSDEMRELDKVADENAKAIDSEYGYYRNLYDMLGDVVDEEGNVLKGKEKQAEYITTILAEALGVEAEMMEGRITDYQNYKDAIYDAIEAKQKEAILSAYEGEYNEALATREEKRQNMSAAGVNVDKQEQVVAVAESNLNNLNRMSHSDLLNTYGDILGGGSGDVALDFQTVRDELTATFNGEKDHLKELQSILRENTKTFQDGEAFILNHDNAFIAKTDELGVALLKLQGDFKTTTNATEEELGLQRAYWNEMLKGVEQDLKEGRVDEATYEMYKEIARQADEQYDIAVFTAADMIERSKKEIENGKPGMQEAGKGSGQSYVDGMNSVDYEGYATSAAQRYGVTFRNWIAYYANEVRATIAGIKSGSLVVEEGVTINSPSDLRAYADRVPKTATGGIVTRAQVRMVGEDGAEAIVPLEKNTHWIDLVASKVAIAMNGAAVNNSSNTSTNKVTNNFYQTNNSPKSLSRLEIYRQTKNLLNYKGR